MKDFLSLFASAAMLAQRSRIATATKVEIVRHDGNKRPYRMVEQNRKDARAATASFTGWTRDETELFLKTVGRLVKDQINPLKDEIAKLKTQVAELQQNGVRFCGAHQRAIGYRTGEMVSYDGSIWCAVADVKPMEIPGKAAVWQLAVRGQPQPRSPTKHGELRPPQLVEERRT